MSVNASKIAHLGDPKSILVTLYQCTGNSVKSYRDFTVVLFSIELYLVVLH